MDIMQADQTYIASTYKRYGVVFTGGQGSVLQDEDGREYIDFGGGIAVNTFGVIDEAWRQAVIDQVNRLQHTSNLYYTEPQVKLAQLLCQKTGMSRVFFSNSGAEANECMIKAARKYGGDRKTIITLQNSFHGRTIATLAATGQEAFHQYFDPFPAGFDYARPDDLDDMIRLLARHNPCAIMIELIQGEGGVHVLEPSYVQALATLCRARDILLLIDEVQTGNGRTGALYAFMKYHIQPDIVSTAKGLGGGLPLGATLFNEKTAGVLDAGSHGSTFGGNPVCAAGAFSVLERLTPALLSEVEEKSRLIFDYFRGVRGVKSISGMGLMIGIETEKPAGEIVAACLARGVAPITAKNRVRLLPALNIPLDLLKTGLAILKEEIEP